MRVLTAILMLAGSLAAQVSLTERQARLVIYRADSLVEYKRQWRQDSTTIDYALVTIAGYQRKAGLDSTALAMSDSLVNASQARQAALQRAIGVRNGIIAGSMAIVALLSCILVLK